MGMFDYMRCEVPLPDGFKGELQTKDFDDPYMLTHVISAEGRLMQSHLLRIESVPKAERPYPDAKGIMGLAGSLRGVTDLRDANFHGVLNFYGGEGSDWHEYNAKFTDGQLVKIDIADSNP